MGLEVERQSERFKGGELARKLQLGDAIWETFAVRLAAYLTRMFDSEDNELVLQSPRMGAKSGEPVRARFTTVEGGAHVRVEMSGDALFAQGARLGDQQICHLRERGWLGGDQVRPVFELRVTVFDALWVADQVSGAVRDAYCLIDPGLLSVSASGPATKGIPILGLSMAGECDSRSTDAATPVMFLRTREEFLDTLRTELQDSSSAPCDGELPPLDQDGDLVLMHHGHPVWVRVMPDQPAIQLMTVVVPEVVSRRQAAVELNELNRHSAWSKWTLRGRVVWQTHLMPAQPFVPVAFHEALASFLGDLDGSADQLTFRLRGDA